MNRKQVEKLVGQYSQAKKLDHRLYYGRIHGDDPRKFWYLTPFGGHAFKIGNTLADAGEWLRTAPTLARRTAGSPR